MVFVKETSFCLILEQIHSASSIAIDTETTGKDYYKGARLFSIIVSTPNHDFYFNFNKKKDNEGNTIDCLHRSLIPKIISPDYSGRIYMHNAKFDLQMLLADGLDLRAHRIYDTMGLARINQNGLMQLKLDFLAKLVGGKKDKSVDEYITKHKLYTKENIPTKKEPDKNKHYDLVPHDMMLKYGVMDGHLTLKLGEKLIQSIANQDEKHPGQKKLRNILEVERKLTTPVLLSMRDRGFLIDRKYCEEAYKAEVRNYQKASDRYKEISGINFTDSNANHAKAFTAIGQKFPLTEKGNPSFKDEVLTSMDTELANVLKDYRYSYKKAHTYFANFLHLSDSNDVIHCELNQFKGRTGRMSSSSPNLQNLNRPREGEEFLVRKAFISREGFDLFMLDFDQFEYRMMVNKAGEMGLINQILHDGLDVHTATANLADIPRQQAKTVNFLLLYGGGIAVLARELFATHLSEDTLKKIQALHWEDYNHPGKNSCETIANKLSLELWEVVHGVEILVQAFDLRMKYFSKLPSVKRWVKGIISQAEKGPIYNQFGRKFTFSRNFAYKAPNYAIQGGTADWIKLAMCRIYDLLLNKKSKMILQVHDELIFEIHKSERYLVPMIRNIMQQVDSFEYVPYTVGASISETSWADKMDYELA